MAEARKTAGVGKTIQIAQDFRFLQRYW